MKKKKAAFWTATEQKLFANALERFAENPHEDIWLALSEAIGTKSVRETYCFAFSYLLQLQASAKDFLEETRLHNIEFTQWKQQENKIFESFLTVFPDSEENRWEKISGALCARKFYRSPEEVERHFLRLVFDVNNIICNEKVFTTLEAPSVSNEVEPSRLNQVINQIPKKERQSISSLELLTPLKRARSFDNLGDNENIQPQLKKINLEGAMNDLKNN